MSTRTRARQLAQRLLAEIEELLTERDELRSELARLGAEAEGLRRQLADARDPDGALVLAHDEEG